MQLRNLNKTLRFSVLAVLVLLLIAIRAFEHRIFYDPFLDYFKNDYLNLPFPTYDGLALLGSMLLRYLINSAISVVIIYLVFSDASLIKLTVVLYAVLGLLLLLVLFGLLYFSDSQSNFVLFYVRRLLIQPLFLLLFLPAFYFQKIKEAS